MPLIQFKDVSKTYHTGKVDFPALDQVSFTVESGEFLSIAGPSGSGKTTILNIVGCLDQPTAGAFHFSDRNIAEQTSNQLADIRRHHIGFVFQTFNLIPVLSAFENVEFPLLMKGDLSPQERKRLAGKMLAEVGLADFQTRRPAEMSGGQQQRVAIARALVKQPKLVLADEPTANLDSQTGQEILELMKAMNQKTGTTFLFSTHDRMVMDRADRLILLKDGRIADDEKRR